MCREHFFLKMGLEIERTEDPPRSTASRSPPDRKSARNPAKARQAGEFSMAVTSRSIAIAFTSARRCAARAVASDALARERAATPREGSGTAREAMFAGRNRGAWIATAFRMTNFDLDAATRIGGIKLRTARGETTPLARTANPLPITQTTSRQAESMRARPSLHLPPWGARHRENMEGCTRQGGPR